MNSCESKSNANLPFAQCCERELREEIGTKVKVHFWSNAPAGCYSYPYPDNYSHNDGHHGSKVHTCSFSFSSSRVLISRVSYKSRSNNAFFYLLLLVVVCVQVFFYHAEYVSGEPHPDNKEVVDFAWVTRDELQEYFDPQLFKFVRDMLPA